jgi:hypothetical protein
MMDLVHYPYRFLVLEVHAAAKLCRPDRTLRALCARTYAIAHEKGLDGPLPFAKLRWIHYLLSMMITPGQ